MILGGAVVSLVFMGSVWGAENKVMIKNFKKKNPTLFVLAVMGASYFLMSLFGGVMVFIFGITFPLLCKFPKFSTFMFPSAHTVQTFHKVMYPQSLSVHILLQKESLLSLASWIMEYNKHIGCIHSRSLLGCRYMKGV